MSAQQGNTTPQGFPGPLLDEATQQGETAAHVFGLPELRHQVGRQGGDIAGLGTGGSIDFHDQRAYLPGDDVRHINWQAYGRTGAYTMKLFREEVQPLVDVVLDLSASMSYREDKAARSAGLVAFSGFAATRSGASARFWAVSGQATPTPVTAEDILAGRWPDHLPDQDQDQAWDGDLSALPFRHGSVRLLLSDLLFDATPSRTLIPLAHDAGLALIWAPYCQDEADPAWQDNCELQDAETHHRLPIWCDPPMLRRYHDAYARHFELWSAEARQLGAPLARIPSDGTLHDALLLTAQNHPHSLRLLNT